jgi:hypothetical protein
MVTTNLTTVVYRFIALEHRKSFKVVKKCLQDLKVLQALSLESGRSNSNGKHFCLTGKAYPSFD